MRYYYDTEFLEDGKTIDLISIGIVAEDGREYYAVCSDADWQAVANHRWLPQNVVLHLPLEKGYRELLQRRLAKTNSWLNHHKAVDLDLTDLRVKPRWVIANEVREFLLAGETVPELWAWYAAYDHVALAQLWGSMIKMPAGIPMWTNDLRQEQHRLELDASGIPEQQGPTHDALADARWNKEVWHALQKREVRDRALSRPDSHPEIPFDQVEIGSEIAFMNAGGLRYAGVVSEIVPYGPKRVKIIFSDGVCCQQQADGYLILLREPVTDD